MVGELVVVVLRILGVLAWELFSIGMIPYADISEDEVLHAAIVSGLRLEQPFSCPSILWNLIVDCWDARPACRPSASHFGVQLLHVRALFQYCQSSSLQLLQALAFTGWK